MDKDFDSWNELKKATHVRRDASGIYFREREVWWGRLGVNIGYEQDGTGDGSLRPVVVLKKYNPHVLLVTPLSATKKRGTYYFQLGRVDRKDAVAILSQIRLIDVRRLENPIGTIPKKRFILLVRAIVAVNFGPWLEKSPKSSPPPFGRG